jgi:hypothetical protein
VRGPTSLSTGRKTRLSPLNDLARWFRPSAGTGVRCVRLSTPTPGHGDAVERAYAPGSELYDWFAAILAAHR